MFYLLARFVCVCVLNKRFYETLMCFALPSAVEDIGLSWFSHFCGFDF